MEALSEARQILESMVTQLGFDVTIEQEESEENHEPSFERTPMR